MSNALLNKSVYFNNSKKKLFPFIYRYTTTFYYYYYFFYRKKNKIKSDEEKQLSFHLFDFISFSVPYLTQNVYKRISIQGGMFRFA